MSRLIMLAAAVLGLAAGLAYSSEDHGAVVDLTSETYEDAVRPALLLLIASDHPAIRGLRQHPARLAGQRRQGLLHQVLRALVR
jgi:hypothetical protein